jgi:hypothetical protein
MRSVLVGIALLSLVSPVLPACAGAGSGGSHAPELPVHFPLPPGTAILSSASPFPSQIVVLGVIPADLQ